MESVRCAPITCRRIGKWIDNLQLLDDRAGPPVRDNERQRIFMFRANVNEMNVKAVDLSNELREGVQSRFDLTPVILLRPILRDLLHCVELDALRCIPNEFLLRPPSRSNASAQFSQFHFRNIHMKRANSILYN